jgi:hypothetical protein
MVLMSGIIKLGTCIKCNQPVYADNIHGSPDKCNILLQKCIKGGDCEVDVLKTPLAKRNRFAD